MDVEVDPPSPVELHSFGRQQRPLEVLDLALATAADLTAGVDHTVPGDVILFAERMERPADLTRRTGHPRQRRYLTVGRDAARWDDGNRRRSPGESCPPAGLPHEDHLPLKDLARRLEPVEIDAGRRR